MNNYPMDTAWQLVKAGEYPAHHLWGLAGLGEYGIEVDILPYQRIVRLKHTRYGDMDQQLRALLRASRYDVIYSACASTTAFLARLRQHGMFSKRLVAILYSVQVGQRFIDGHDKLICLSSRIQQQLADTYRTDGKIETLHWGQDLDFCGPMIEFDRRTGGYILASGKTHRDYDTFLQACKPLDFPVLISCGEGAAPAMHDVPPHVTVRARWVSSRDSIDEHRHAYAIAIPIRMPVDKTPDLYGLTSLLDAMAAGTPVVMTRNDLFDIDIEKEGIGLWVEPGDVHGWTEALSYLIASPGVARAMGERGRRLAEQSYNLKTFTAGLGALLKRIV